MPQRPDWSCVAPGCGEPWPCSTERADLLRAYRRAQLSLRIYMASVMHDAIEDAVRHPTDTGIDFWPRFLGWIPALRPTDLEEDLMYKAIVSPQEGKFIAIRPGCRAAMQLPSAFYAALTHLTGTGGLVPDWFADAAREA